MTVVAGCWRQSCGYGAAPALGLLAVLLVSVATSASDAAMISTAGNLTVGQNQRHVQCASRTWRNASRVFEP